MSIKLPIKDRPKANQPQVGFNKGSTKKVSYNQREEYICEIEDKLMSRFKCGYSALHKKLILKEANNQFSGVYL